MPLGAETLASLQALRDIVRQNPDWKSSVDQLLTQVRGEFVYDHVALYLLDPRTGGLEVGHARAIGRGRSLEADVTWGEGLAGQVIAQQETIIQEPVDGRPLDRLEAAYVIGLPVRVGGRVEGALVFVRFGGPVYSDLHRLLAHWLADVVGSALESRALREARGELQSVQRQMRMQEDFVSNVSHELRTPLGFIKGYATSLLRQDTTWDNATQREFLLIIEEEADRLSHLIDNMLESARFQSQTARVRLQPLQVDALVRDITNRVRARQPDLQVNLEFDHMPPILGDGVRLAQVFENLFGNAFKYAAGSPITIGMQHDDRTLRVSFADQGPGIPEEYLPFVFQRFYRVPAESSSTGTGLGLYICQQIVLAHRGKIWAESILDRGTTFIIELPLSPSTSA